jgi:hypothetical protein
MPLELNSDFWLHTFFRVNYEQAKINLITSLQDKSFKDSLSYRSLARAFFYKP